MSAEIHTNGQYYFDSGSYTTPHYEPPAETNVGNEIRDPSDLVAWFSPITLDPALLDFLNSPFRPISGNNNSGMPSEITLEDDLTHPDLVFIKYVVQQYQSMGAIVDERVLNGISGVDFADPEFVQQAYEWVDELAGSDLWLSIDIASWLFANGAYDPDQPAPTPDFVVNNPPVQVSYDSPQEAIQANGVPLVEGQGVDQFSVMNLPSGVLVDPVGRRVGRCTALAAGSFDSGAVGPVIDGLMLLAAGSYIAADCACSPYSVYAAGYRLAWQISLLFDYADLNTVNALNQIAAIK